MTPFALSVSKCCPYAERRAGPFGWLARPAAQGRLRQAQAEWDEGPASGFTLVELMVVITVIALASAAAVLAMPDPKGRVFDEAARFATRAKAARDVAIVEGAPVSLWVTAGGYGFDRRADGAWAPLSDKPFRLERWRDGTRAAIGGVRQRIVFDPTGLADRPLSVKLTRDRASVTATVEADGRAHVD